MYFLSSSKNKCVFGSNNDALNSDASIAPCGSGVGVEAEAEAEADAIVFYIVTEYNNK
jgi:hypothetical protein